MQSDWENIKNKVSESLEILQKENWEPTNQLIDEMENLGYLGIVDPKQICLLLGINAHQLAYITFHYGALQRHQLGMAKALRDLNQSALEIAKGNKDPIAFQATKYLLQSRFGYDEHKAQTKSREKMEAKKLKFAKSVHRDNIDIATTRLISSLSEENLHKVK